MHGAADLYTWQLNDPGDQKKALRRQSGFLDILMVSWAYKSPGVCRWRCNNTKGACLTLQGLSWKTTARELLRMASRSIILGPYAAVRTGTQADVPPDWALKKSCAVFKSGALSALSMRPLGAGGTHALQAGAGLLGAHGNHVPSGRPTRPEEMILQGFFDAAASNRNSANSESKDFPPNAEYAQATLD